LKTIKVTVSPSGETKVQTVGYAGPDCLAASKFLEDALGLKASEHNTAEFYYAPITQQELQQ
jgi:hypothetical protein